MKFEEKKDPKMKSLSKQGDYIYSLWVNISLRPATHRFKQNKRDGFCSVLSCFTASDEYFQGIEQDRLGHNATPLSNVISLLVTYLVQCLKKVLLIKNHFFFGKEEKE